MTKEEIVPVVESVTILQASAHAFLDSSEPDANTKLFCRKKIGFFAFFYYVFFFLL
jgi:hypothetical protein